MSPIPTASLRARLLAVVAIATMPTLLLASAGIGVLHTRLQALHRADVQLAARAGAVAGARLVGGVVPLLTTLARLPALRQGDRAACRALLADLARRFDGQYAGIGLADGDGAILCSSRDDGAPPASVADRPWFQAAWPATGVTLAESGGAAPALAATLALAAEDGGARTLLFAEISNAWLDRQVRALEVPDGARLLMADAAGTVIAPLDRAGEALPAALTEQAGPLTVDGGGDGPSRVLALAPIGDLGLSVVMDVPAAAVFEATDDIILILRLVLLGLAGLAVTGAWIGVRNTVLRRLAALTEAADRISRGDLEARSGLPHDDGELGRLSRAFDGMAAAIARRTAERTEQLSLMNEALLADLAAHRRAEAALRASEARFHALAKASPVGIFRTEPEGRCVYVNEQWCTLSGQPADQAMGAGWRAAIHPDDRPALDAEWARALERSRPFHQEFRLRRPDGAEAWVFGQAVPERDRNGRLVGFVGTITDISESRSIKEALERARAEAETARAQAEGANLAKSRFLAAASHDLRQPFQAMRLFQHLLMERLADPELRKIATKMDEAMAAGEELLKALLDVSTLEAGTVQPRLATVALGDMLRRLADEFEPQAAAKGLGFRVVPCAAATRSDPVLLERMVRNLLSNALRYTERGRILLGCRRQGDALWIEVWDTGVGIAADKLGVIFEDFVQLCNPERDRTRGLGLGLSVVERTARLLGHDVSVRSQPGRGSVFALRVTQVARAAERIAVSERPAA